jgi:hypothetical protein
MPGFQTNDPNLRPPKSFFVNLFEESLKETDDEELWKRNHREGLIEEGSIWEASTIGFAPSLSKENIQSNIRYNQFVAHGAKCIYLYIHISIYIHMYMFFCCSNVSPQIVTKLF